MFVPVLFLMPGAEKQSRTKFEKVKQFDLCFIACMQTVQVKKNVPTEMGTIKNTGKMLTWYPHIDANTWYDEKTVFSKSVIAQMESNVKI